MMMIAYQFAVSMAAEIAFIVPASPKMHGDEEGRYEDELGGARMFGVHGL